jgi:hypothetical protein
LVHPFARHLLHELAADVNCGHNLGSTVFIEARSMYRPDGPFELRPVGEVEFVQGLAAAAATGLYGPCRAASAIIGLGKSRITAALPERLQTEPHTRVRYFCSPYHQDSALFLFINQLRRAAEFAPDDPPASKLAKLEALLAPRRAAGRGCGIPRRSAVIAGYHAAAWPTVPS